MIQYFRDLAAKYPRRARIGLTTAVLALLVTLIVVVRLTLFLGSPPGTGGTSRIVDFARAGSLRKLADDLEKGGIIGSARLFVVYARLQGADSRVQAGTYRFTDAMKPAEILRMMVAGQVYERKFAVPEGYSIYQLAELLAGKGFFRKDDFLGECRDQQLLKEMGIPGPSVEGYLYPSTYNLVGVNDARTLVRTMVQQFRKTYGERFAAAERGSGLTRHQIVTLASIIEKEAVVPDERPRIASVFFNRLRVGMPLQSDPTAVYGVRAFAGKISRQDIERESPYNTYRIKGLPPGPIGNPSAGALEAVLNPDRTGYYYFVARNDGTHHFSATLTEHNQAVNRYLRAAATGSQNGAAATTIKNDRPNLTGRR